MVGINRIAQGNLAPHPSRKLILYRVRSVLGNVNEGTGRLELRQDLELDLTQVWLIIGLDGCKQLAVFNRTCTHIAQCDMNFGMSLVEERNLLVHAWNPGPVGQGHRTSGGTAARTGATTTSGEGNHEYERNGDEGKPGCKASQRWESEEKLHRLKPPLDL